MPKRNENCLKGICCPKCGHVEDFYITGQSTCHALDDGTEGHTDTEWDDKSSCRCGNSACEFVGDLEDFLKLNDIEKEHLVGQILQDCYDNQNVMYSIVEGYVEQNYDRAGYQDYFTNHSDDDEGEDDA